MPLPETIRVKLSSESAEAISITPVVVQDLPVRELIEHMLGVTGKDEPRILELLRRGTLVSGASRFRWTGWESDPESLRTLLATFPDPDPSRAFSAPSCVHATLSGGRRPLAIPRSAAEKTGLFRRESFWRLLMEVAAPGLAYAGYSYRERTDRYGRELHVREVERLRAEADRLRYSVLRDQVRAGDFNSILLAVER
jgi:hypothetical protein